MSYHMRRKDREITDPADYAAIIARNRYAVIGLCRDNSPYVVTLDYGYEAATQRLYFHCGREGKKLDFIRANPLACVTIIDDGGETISTCDHSFRSLVLDGTIECVEEAQEVELAIRLMIEHLEKVEAVKMYAKLNPGNNSYANLQILRFEIKQISGKERQTQQIKPW